MAGNLIDHLQPADLIHEWRSCSRAQLQAREGDTPMLLVKLDGEGRDLAQSLAAASTVRGEQLQPTRDSIGFRTVAAAGPAVQAMASGAEDREELERRLRKSTHFVVPLKKRKGADRPFAERIFVGRAYSNDVVLRHRSVSKTHVWFECDSEGRFVLADAGSKNGTQLNGEPLNPRETRVLEQGDRVTFGKIESTYTQPATLWEIIRTAR